MTEPITDRLRAALADRYELIEELGAGGMATVYLANDIKHERKVAVKVLRPELAAVIGGERFITEIKTTAALQHPHILPLFDSGEADSFLYYVMPFVEGESLRAKLDRERQFEVDEALHIAKAVASALQYAHDRDIIHRDIKPENILLHAGEPVVADFGIALAISAAGGGRMTETGLSLGTPHYMSPEQAAADRDLSARSDVYSLACVLYEMLAGQPPHTGPTAQSILVRILTEHPRPVSDARPTVPKHIRAVVSKGLEKLPADRFKSAEEFKAALDDTAFTYERTAPTGAHAGAGTTGTTAAAPGVGLAPGRGSLGGRLHVGVTVFLALLVGWLALWSGSTASVAVDAPVVSFVALDSMNGTYDVAVAGDGTIAYVGPSGQLMVRAPGALTAVPLTGIDDAVQVAFSPDGHWIAYTTASGPLRKVQTIGGGEATLWSEEGQFAFTPSWGDDGFVYFSLIVGAPNQLARVPETGGEVESLFESPNFILAPVSLPGGRGIAFTHAPPSMTDSRVLVLDLESRDTVTVAASGLEPAWSSSGHLLYAQTQGTVWALPFDPNRLEPLGEAVPVLEGLATFFLQATYAISPSGTMAYMEGPEAGGTVGEFEFALMGLDGSVEMLPIASSDHYDARVSPDGSRLAYTKGSDIWVFDLDRGSNNQITQGGSAPHNPAWSPDGTQIAFDGGATIFAKASDGSGEAREIGGSNGIDYPVHWLEDGTIIFATSGSSDLWSIPEQGGSPTGLLTADWIERAAQVSPDGAWIAYSSSRTGDAQLYVRSWPELQGEVRISPEDEELAAFGNPQWSPDGRSVIYQKGNDLYAADLDFSNGASVAGIRKLDASLIGWLQHMHPDGRLLVAFIGGAAEADPSARSSRLIVSTNWFTELRARFGGVR